MTQLSDRDIAGAIRSLSMLLSTGQMAAVDAMLEADVGTMPE